MPKIAVLGLNPHCENFFYKSEEKNIIDKQILENKTKLENISEKLQNPKLDASELQNFNLQN